MITYDQRKNNQRKTRRKEMARINKKMYRFLSKPDDSLKCLICQEVAKEPWQHGECESLFCKECLDRHGRDKPCPNCRMNKPQYFPDNRRRKDTKALPVKCNNVDKKCKWIGTVGTLEKHLTTCSFALLPCPNKCKDSRSKVKHFMRKNLDKHLTTDCPNRVVKCEHCGEGIYWSITQGHDETCEKKIVPCTNTGCRKRMKYQHIPQHIKSECEYTVIACKYKSIGCETELKRKDMPAHELDDKLHLHMAINTITQLKEDVTKLKCNTSQLEEQLEETTTQSNEIITRLENKLNEKGNVLEDEETNIFRFVDYKERKKKNADFTSPPFYTSQGYHMTLKVYANGNGDGEGTHVSVFAEVVEGKHDPHLSWPLVGSITITLLNQLEDDNHHSMVIPLTGADNIILGSSWGYHEFIPHSALGHDPIKNTQYLKDNTLCFKLKIESYLPQPNLVKSTSAADIKGIEVLQETKVYLTNEKQQFKWKGYGLRLDIPPQSLPDDTEIVTITIKASLSGQYQFPSDSELVSPVFWLHCSPSCRFKNPLTLEIGHCAPPKNSSKLRMCRALCSQTTLPYAFKVIQGGSFSTQSSYGFISLERFSGLAAVQKESNERRYWSSVFYMGPVRKRDVHFAVTWDDDTHITTLKNEYKTKNAMNGPEQSLDFSEECITLDIPKNGCTQDGWKICPTNLPKIHKEKIDSKHSKTMEHCEMVARWTKQDQEIQPLEYLVDISGTTDENFFTIIIDPSDIQQEYNSLTRPSLPTTTTVRNEDTNFLAGQLQAHASRWESIGTALNFQSGELENIRHSNPRATPQLLLTKMLNEWSQWPTSNRPDVPTMEKLHDALRSGLVGLGAVANDLYELRNSLPSQQSARSGHN